MNEKFVIGSISLEVYCPEARSLKDKRQVIKSFMSRLKNQYNIAVKEVANEDKWQLATIGIVTLDKNEFMVHNTIENILRFIERTSNLQLLNYSKEIL